MAEILFISDLHLAPERPEIIDLFCRFVDDRASAASALYILGDFLEYWLGDDDRAEGLEPVFAALHRLTDKDIPVYLMHGNRDFLIGEDFASRCGCQLIPDPFVTEFFGEKVLLSHGDSLCTDDVEYQAFKAQIRHPAQIKAFLDKPLSERENIAQLLRQQSREATRLKQSDIQDVNQEAVKEVMRQQGVQLLIHGHTHRPAIHELTISDRKATRIVLGDWYSKGSYLSLKDSHDFNLNSWA